MNGADTAWIMVATALVLFMTLPGLALFYGGLVRARNVLSVFMHCYAIACLMSVLWFFFGYSIAFGGGTSGFWGGLDKMMLLGIDADTLSGSLPEVLFFAFQMTFAIITPALIVGAYVERIGFGFVMLFSGLWMLLCYAPVVHWVWGGGFLADGGIFGDTGVRDFAGGIVVHETAGLAALLIAIFLGPRRHQTTPPHSPGFVMIGAAMLWVGWFGFNAGSALGANSDAARAMMVTHISAATASLVWMLIEWVSFRKPTLVGIATGMVAGLATITPAAGSVGPLGAIIIGILAAGICYAAVSLIRQKLKIDDSLDVFAVHGVGGILGSLLIPFLASAGPLAPGLEMSTGAQFGVQILGVIVVAVFSAIVTAAILFAIKLVMPLRVSAEDEENGLDTATHGETAYHM